jgi:hypothetical protein
LAALAALANATRHTPSLASASGRSANGNNRDGGSDDQNYKRLCHATDVALLSRTTPVCCVLTRADLVGGAAV